MWETLSFIAVRVNFFEAFIADFFIVINVSRCEFVTAVPACELMAVVLVMLALCGNNGVAVHW
jgi:hypothetical protein